MTLPGKSISADRAAQPRRFSIFFFSSSDLGLQPASRPIRRRRERF
jgi:hypothetical protein